jgi:ATP-binding cassette, subfamily B, bacterial
VQNPSRKTIGIYWDHAKKYKALMIGMLVSMMAIIGAELLQPYYLKLFFDKLSSGGTKDDIAGTLIGILVTIVLIGCAKWVFERARHFSVAYFESGTMRDISNTSFGYLHGHSYRFFTDNFAGSLVKKVNRFIHSFENIIDRTYFDLAPLFLKVISIFIILFWVKPEIGVIMLVWSFIFLYLNYKFTVYKWKYDIERAKMDTKVTGVLADTIANNPNLKYFAGLDYELRRFKDITEEWKKKTVLEWNISEIANSVQGLMVIALEFTIFYVAVKAWKQGLLTVGDFVWIQTYLLEVFSGIWRFGRTVRDLYRSFADAEEMTVILNTEHEVRDAVNAKDIIIERGKIEFEKVCFNYDAGKNHEDGEVMHELSFVIKPGEKVALAGPSGGGKTTVVKLIFRLFNIGGGRILIDGQDIKNVTQNSLRSQISFVPQDPILFHRSLMENIRYGRRDATDEEVMIAAKLANCHDFIMSFPEKYNTYVGERGIKLSGGERQRVAIARAILTNAPILILDEATSSLDSVSEKLIQSALENLMKNKTTLVIAHRFSTITRMDRIMVLQGGKVVEDGTHADLIHKESGLYKKLWNLQVGGYLDK